MAAMPRIRLVLAAAGLAAVAAGVAPAVAAPSDPVPTGPCLISKPAISVTNVDTRITVACTTVVVPIVLPHPTLVSACVPHPNAWISGGNIYVDDGCHAVIVIPIPITGPPPGA
jgi:hypothetical protein